MGMKIIGSIVEFTKIIFNKDKEVKAEEVKKVEEVKKEEKAEEKGEQK